MAKAIAKIYLDRKMSPPEDVYEILNPKDIDSKLHNLLQHEFWGENSIPVYDNDPHWHDISLNPDEPESYVNYFWQDEDLLKIVRETNKYIDKKNKLKTKYHPNKKRQLKKKGINDKKNSTHYSTRTKKVYGCSHVYGYIWTRKTSKLLEGAA